MFLAWYHDRIHSISRKLFIQTGIREAYLYREEVSREVVRKDYHLWFTFHDLLSTNSRHYQSSKNNIMIGCDEMPYLILHYVSCRGLPHVSEFNSVLPCSWRHSRITIGFLNRVKSRQISVNFLNFHNHSNQSTIYSFARFPFPKLKNLEPFFLHRESKLKHGLWNQMVTIKSMNKQ